VFFFSSRRRHTRFSRDWSSDVCSSDLSRYAVSIVQIDPQKIFSALNVPILLLEAASEDDPIPVSAENSALASRHPDRITHLVFDADHNIHYQCPREFLRAISEFLDAF